MKISFKKLFFMLSAAVALASLFLTQAPAFCESDSENVGKAASYNIENSRKLSKKESIRVMSFNLLADYKGFGGGDVKPRAELFKSLVSDYMPDVLCLQEESFNWFCSIEKNLEGYRQIRPLTCFLGLKMTSVLYNKSTVTPIKSGELEYENGDDFRTRRAVYALFSQKATGRRFAVISTHLGFLKEGFESRDICVARSQCSELLKLSAALREKLGCAVIIAGDFNSKEGGEKDALPSCEIYAVLKSVLSDAKYTAERVHAEEGLKTAPSNDHIFISGNVEVTDFFVISKDPYSKISDHYPIFADILLKENPP